MTSKSVHRSARRSAPSKSAPRAPRLGPVLGYAAILIAGLLFCLFVQFKAEHETSMALERYRSLSAEKARNARFVAGSGFEQIYQNLRTIGMLPSVMNIDRHGENIDDDARMSIQQIYNNLASTIDLSEIYIVPADFRPDAVDPVTGAPQEPILMFDELVTAFGRNGEASGDAGVTPQEEVEIEEYRQLETLMATLRRDYPSVDSFEGMNAPFFSSEAVITCDNTEFNHTLNDLDRTGVLFSVPFYGADKALKGSVTAILRLNALRKLLPPRDYALVDPAAGVVVTGAEADQTAASSVRVRAGEADPGLLYSEALPLSVNQRETSWRLWAGHADAGFHESPEMAAIEAGRMAGFGLGGGATLLAMLAWAASRRRRAREQAQWRDLSDAAIEGMAICNGEKIVTANRSFCALLDMKPEEVRGRNFQDLLADQAPAQRLRDADGKPVEAALLGAARDVAVEIMSRRIAYMGKPHRVLSVRDLSERKAAEARESAAREAAETRRREMEQRIGAVISAVAAGDFDKRLDLDTDDAFVVEVANGVNRICGIVGEFTADLTQTMSALAQGDLTRRIEADYAGRFGALANSANSTVDRLDDLVGDIQATTAAMRSATSEIADGATDLSSRAESQASSLEQTAATMEQMAATIKQSAENGDRARDLAGEAASRAGRGGAVVQETVTAMERIEASATRISDIVNVIDSIAFQTNLLALNAAVEAARAGEAGKGFAVVASEVRTLAQRSADAAKDISGLIAESSTHVGEGVDLVRRTGDSLTEIVEAVTQMVGAIEAIAEATREQSTGVEEISSAVGHMDDMTQRNATLADQSATSAKDLSVQAERLAGLVGFFRTRAAAGKPAAPAKRAAAAQEGPAQDGTTKEGRAKRARASKERVREDRADSAWAAAEAQTRAQAQTRDAPRMKANAGEEWLDF